MSHAAVIELLNRYFASVERPISQAGGFIDSFAGDEIKVLFDSFAIAPSAPALAMWRALEEFNRRSVALANRSCAWGSASTRGPVVLGTVGGPNRIQCSVIGDTVNLASRIEQLTKVYRARFLIGEHTFQSLTEPQDFAIRRVDRVAVKGKNAAVDVYEVIDAEAPERRAAKLGTRRLLDIGNGEVFWP